MLKVSRNTFCFIYIIICRRVQITLPLIFFHRRGRDAVVPAPDEREPGGGRPLGRGRLARSEEVAGHHGYSSDEDGGQEGPYSHVDAPRMIQMEWQGRLELHLRENSPG